MSSERCWQRSRSGRTGVYWDNPFNVALGRDTWHEKDIMVWLRDGAGESPGLGDCKPTETVSLPVRVSLRWLPSVRTCFSYRWDVCSSPPRVHSPWLISDIEGHTRTWSWQSQWSRPRRIYIKNHHNRNNGSFLSLIEQSLNIDCV